MSAHSPPTPRHDLYERAFTQMSRRVEEAEQPEEMMSALRWGLNELEQTFAKTPAKVLETVACASGCDSCCRVPVDTQAHEVLFAAQHIQVNFSTTALNELIVKLATHRAHMATLAPGQREKSRQACALLAGGACSIYEGRPQPCRSHHTSDAAMCAKHMVDPSVDISKVYIPALRARMFAVMLGVDEALEDCGYDDRAYDFGSALHEALTNSFCLFQWMRHEIAFPDSCLADCEDSM